MKTEVKYDFKAIRKLAREHGQSYHIHNHGGLKYNMIGKNGWWMICEAKTISEAHYDATMRLRDYLINNSIITETDYIV